MDKLAVAKQVCFPFKAEKREKNPSGLFISTVIPRSEGYYFILRNVYFADVMSIPSEKISLFGNTPCDAFIYFSHAVCLFGGPGC